MGTHIQGPGQVLSIIFISPSSVNGMARKSSAPIFMVKAARSGPERPVMMITLVLDIFFLIIFRSSIPSKSGSIVFNRTKLTVFFPIVRRQSLPVVWQLTSVIFFRYQAEPSEIISSSSMINILNMAVRSCRREKSEKISCPVRVD